MKQLVIVLSGRKQAGKSSACNFILAQAANRASSRITKKEVFNINSQGLLVRDGELVSSKDINSITDFIGAKIYSFADPLKRFCVDVLGAPEEACYGTDAEKNTAIPHLLWENMPRESRPFKVTGTEERYVEFSGVTHTGSKSVEYRTGPMTGRELMQAFGTDICRKLYGDCWARGTYSSIKREGFKLALITDGRFPNELDLGSTVEAKTIRLLRKVAEDAHISEKALDHIPLDRYTMVVDNQNMTLPEQCEYITPILNNWFDEVGL